MSDRLPPAPLPERLLNNLRSRYAEPHRHYHTLTHVEALLGHLATWRHLVAEPAHVEAAIWYHDVVCDPRQHDNEVCSADVVRFELMSIGWLGVDVERVALMVEATRDHGPAGDDADLALFLDLDLSVLAAPADAYDRYAKAVRREYAWVSDADFAAGRSRVLGRFLARPTLYQTPDLRAAWEAAARANLQRELHALGG